MGEVRIQLWLVRLFMIGAVAFFAAPIVAQDLGSRLRPLPTARAYQTLVQAEIFNFGGVGYGQAITAEEKAFRQLLVTPNRISTFRRLRREANPEGQLFALYGLYLEDRNVFREEAGQLKWDFALRSHTFLSKGGPASRFEQPILINKRKVTVGRGCILMSYEQTEVIDAIAEGKFDDDFNSSKESWVNTK